MYKNKETTGELFDLIGEMIYDNPVPLIELVKKCHDAKHVIPESFREILKMRNLLMGCIIPKHVRQFILENVDLTKSGGVSMHHFA